MPANWGKGNRKLLFREYKTSVLQSGLSCRDLLCTWKLVKRVDPMVCPCHRNKTRGHRKSFGSNMWLLSWLWWPYKVVQTHRNACITYVQIFLCISSISVKLWEVLGMNKKLSLQTPEVLQAFKGLPQWCTHKFNNLREMDHFLKYHKPSKSLRIRKI